MTGLFLSYSAPTSLFDCLENIQKEVGLIIPRSDSFWDWSSTPRTEMVIRRSHLLEDALSEGYKTTFAPKQLLKVHVTLIGVKLPFLVLFQHQS